MNQEREYTHTVEEFKHIQAEWKESRDAIGRFDQIIIDLRKYGFTLITFLITASGIALQNFEDTSPWSAVVIPFTIMILICGLFLADRYHEVLLLGCILRSRQLEDISEELLGSQIGNEVYNRINLTTFIEEKIQKARARTFSFVIYAMLLSASVGMGLVSLLDSNSAEYLLRHPASWVLVSMFGLSFAVLRVIDLSMKQISIDLQNDVIIDNRIILRVIFQKHEVTAAIKKLAVQVNTAYDSNKFTLITVGLGGLSFASILLQELRRLKRKDFTPFPVFIEHEDKINGTYELKIADMPPPDIIVNRDVLIVDDLVNTGQTLHFLTNTFKKMGARSVQACVLADAQSRHKVKVDIRFVGLNIRSAKPKDNYVGCGMDIHGECRELPYIGVVRSYKGKIAY